MSVRSDASGEYLQYTTSLPALSAVTVLGWGYRVSSNATYEFLVGFEDTAWPTDGTAGVFIGWRGDTAAFYLSDGGGNAVDFASNPGNTTWFRWAITNAGTGATDLKGYVATGNAALASISGVGANFTPAQMMLLNDTYDEWLNARVMGVKMYSAVLTSAEIDQEHRRLLPYRTANLFACWPMVGATAAANLIDISGNGRNLTAGGTLTVEDNAPVSWGSENPETTFVVTSSGAVTGGTISTTATLAAPSLSYTVDVAAAFKASGSTLSAPSVVQLMSGATIGSTATVAAPTLAYVVSTAFKSSGSVLTVPAVDGGAPSLFPLQVSASGRYFEYANGTPVYIQGYAAWALGHHLSQADAETYLDTLQGLGYNAIILSVTDASNLDASPGYPVGMINLDGDTPFGITPNLGTPTANFWAHIRDVAEACRDRDIIILLSIAYLGLQDSDGIRTLLASSSTGTCTTYGEYVADLLGDLNNIIWIHGGDVDPSTWGTKVRAIWTGVENELPGSLHGSHWDSNDLANEYPSILSATEMSVLNVYVYPDLVHNGTQPPVGSFVYDHYLISPARPVMLWETDYEDDFRDKSDDYIRAQYPRALCSGAMGSVLGNVPAWYQGIGWEAALSTALSQSISAFWDMINAIEWWKLVPSRDGALITSGGGDPDTDTGIQAALAADGALAIAFYPSSSSVTFDLSEIAGPLVLCRWWDVDAGTYTTDGLYAATGTRAFTPPSAGAWVLILEEADGVAGATIATGNTRFAPTVTYVVSLAKITQTPTLSVVTVVLGEPIITTQQIPSTALTFAPGLTGGLIQNKSVDLLLLSMGMGI